MVNDALWGGVLMLWVGGVALWGSAHGAGGQVSVWLFPRLAAAALVLCGGVLVAQGLGSAQRVRVWEQRSHATDVLGFGAAAVAYAVLLSALGFWLLTGLLVGGTAYVFSGAGRVRRLVGWLAVGLLLGLAADALFAGVFRVPLPGGRLWGEGAWRPWVP